MAAIARGTLSGSALTQRTGTASGTVTKGDLLVGSSGSVAKATGGNSAGAIIGIATETVTTGLAVQYIVLTPDVLVSIPVASGDTITDLATWGLDATTLELSDDEASTYHRVRVIATDPQLTTNKLCVSIGIGIAA
jgi:hypothetical protein